MRSLEDEIALAVKPGQHVASGFSPVYNGADAAMSTETCMHAVGEGGYRLSRTVYDQASHSERSSDGYLSVL
ncbi:hypothetical protein [Streptomyces nodosus]|uniref:hypothetical protein n=1 Tax=Streptomyces nodosus TaxID=40318 RepID=UPI001185D22D|nr:hypothetical protein [Streptomyces nodosus]MBB4795106.1 hypothetical protein [Streptomyces nodosus]